GLGSFWRQVREWRRQKFDLAILFQNAFEAAAIAFLARVPLRFGYDTERRGKLLTNAIPLPAWKNQRHEMFFYRNIVAELERLLRSVSLVEEREPDFELKVSADRRQRAKDFLREHGIGTGSPLVLLCPGSINSRAKRWSAERF